MLCLFPFLPASFACCFVQQPSMNAHALGSQGGTTNADGSITRTYDSGELATTRPDGSVSFSEPPATEISVDNRKYNLKEVSSTLSAVLKSQDSELKKRWLVQILRFREGLQDKVVPVLLDAYKTEADGAVRKLILHALSFSGDPRSKEIYLLAVRDPYEPTRLLAAYALSSSGDLRWVGTIVQLLDSQNEEVRTEAGRALSFVAQQQNLDFKFEPKPNSSDQENIRSYTALCKVWWAKNKSKYGAE
jgi:hypothetical protein